MAVAQSLQKKYEASATNMEADHLSILPIREEWGAPLVQYKKFWLKPSVVDGIMKLQVNFNARHDDIILISNPKCGTTWLKALAFTVVNRDGVEDQSHPIRTCHPQELVKSIAIPPGGDLTYFDKLPSPRILFTHTPFSLLPKSITDQGARIVYICRDPKDAFVSRWHFQKKKIEGFNMELDAAVNFFCEGFTSVGPFWDHCLEYWEQSIQRPDKVLFLKYEDLVLETVKWVKVLAAFLGVPFTREEEDGGVPEEVVKLCSFDTLSGANQTGAVTSGIAKSAFFRKGKVGDWANHMTAEMGRKIDSTVGEKLKGSGLVF